MAGSNGYTPTQKRILDVLKDGLAHRKDELRACLWDEMGHVNNIKVHITALRKRLNPRGLDIVCVAHKRRKDYMMVRRINRRAE